MIYDILACMHRWGFENVLIIDLHGGPVHRNAVVEGVVNAGVETGTRARMIVPYRRAKSLCLKGNYDHL